MAGGLARAAATSGLPLRTRGEGDAPSGYRRRTPEDTILYDVVRDRVETFLETARQSDRTIPRFVEREFRTYLQCGILAHGFVRVHCDDCGNDRVVAFCCKGRGFCPSCGGRRMADTAAHLVDRVIPQVPVRQWVMSLPISLRYRMAYDAELTAAVLRLFIGAVFASYRRRAKKLRAIRSARCGAVSFIQRFGDALNVNVHFHTLVLDGVYTGEQPQFTPLPPPSNEEVARTTAQVVRRLMRLLERRGLTPQSDPTDADPLATDEPLLAEIYAASVRGRVATGPRAGNLVVRLGDRIDPEDLEECVQGPRCASINGVSLHANVAVPARDRRRLERLCRYVARPPVATQRLSRLPDGRLLYQLKRRWRDGTTAILFQPDELIEKLAALVPPPRIHMVRYYGVLGPRADERRAIVARPGSSDEDAMRTHARPACQHQSAERDPAATPSRRAAPDDQPQSRPRRLSWADLMRRVFATDVLQCSRCGGRMRVLAAIYTPEPIRAILECLNLPPRAPPIAPAQACLLDAAEQAEESPEEDQRHDNWPD